ncbi:MAG: hypothetical protein U0990_11055 [Candidatus Nanopelagicales bacterium]|nr:hypothetical protein [Candidatus Nanopelagicales bacterium]
MTQPAQAGTASAPPVATAATVGTVRAAASVAVGLPGGGVGDLFGLFHGHGQRDRRW